MNCQLLSVQTGTARKVQIQGRSILTAIRKTAVTGPVPVMPLGLLGDEQADPSVHGGLDKAVYAYPSEHYEFWCEARREAGVADIDDQLPFGAMGEN
ncbi:MAG: MOSC domain-containing protein, partial [Betaproteobacteria bacterium]|nr:MOSC domain-containing protein [Betaproteobacteria bacterium]